MKKPLPEKTCVVCSRSFTWRKKWEKVWEQVKYCSKRCRGQRDSVSHEKKQVDELSEEDLDRLIRMAWEDRTPFDAILVQFGLNEAQVIDLMRKSLRPNRFTAWRKRVHENGDLKDRSARGFKVGVFKSRMQRIDGTIKKR